MYFASFLAHKLRFLKLYFVDRKLTPWLFKNKDLKTFAI